MRGTSWSRIDDTETAVVFVITPGTLGERMLSSDPAVDEMPILTTPAVIFAWLNISKSWDVCAPPAAAVDRGA